MLANDTKTLESTAKRLHLVAPSRPNAAPGQPKIPNIDSRFVERIMNEMLDSSNGVEWSDIAGLQSAKRCVMEMIV